MPSTKENEQKGNKGQGNGLGSNKVKPYSNQVGGYSRGLKHPSTSDIPSHNRGKI